MITTLYGPNDYLIQQELASMISRRKSEEITRLDGQKLESDTLAELLHAGSLFSRTRLIIIRDLSLNSALSDDFQRLFSNLADDVTVVLLEPNIDKRTKLFRLLKTLSQMREYRCLSSHELVAWLLEQAKKLDGNLDRATAGYLVGRVGEDQRRLSSELEKLIIYEPNITVEIVDQMVERTPQESIFELIDTTVQGNNRRSLDQYRELRRANSDPYYVMSMIVWQLHNMLLIKAAKSRNLQTIASETGTSPYVVQKTASLVSSMDIGNIKRMIDVASKADMLLKRTSADTDVVVEQLLMKIAQAAKD